MTVLRIAGLTVSLGGESVLRSVDLEVGSGETVALLGPSGSGKTTLLYAIAGLVVPDDGTIEIDGRVMTPDVGPERRSIGMVFQNYALWPHLDALSTVAYPLLRRGMKRSDAVRRAGELLDLVGIGDLAGRRPDELSGGQQQRVGVARALAAEPRLLLLDEPTAHLDVSVRHAMQEELMRRGQDAASVYTTHDAAEAMAVGDRVGVLHGGRIAQIDAPAEVYASPVDAPVATLTGPGTLVDGVLVRAGGGRIEASIGGEDIVAAGGAACGPGPVRFLIRPEWAVLGGSLEGVVTSVRYDGPHTDYKVTGPIGDVVIRRPGPPELRVGDRAGWGVVRMWAMVR